MQAMRRTTMRFQRRTGPQRRRLAALGALACLLLAGCGSNAVDRAEALWQAAGLDAYRFQARDFHSVWCYYDLEVGVRGGQVVSGYVTANPGPAQQCGHYGDTPFGQQVAVDPGELADWTVPHLFDVARSLAAEQGEPNLDITLEFDSDLGYPTRLARDNEMAYDDDWFITVSALEPPGGAAQ